MTLSLFTLSDAHSYNSVVFETIAANNVDFLVVAPEFFTNKNGWRLSQGNGSIDSTTVNFVSRLQDLLLDGKYLDRTRFENLTDSECVSRYIASFIVKGGAGFGVPTPEYRQVYGLNATSSLLRAESGSGQLPLRSGVGGDPKYSCKIREALLKGQI